MAGAMPTPSGGNAAAILARVAARRKPRRGRGVRLIVLRFATVVSVFGADAAGSPPQERWFGANLWGAVDPARVAALLGIVDVDVTYGGIAEEALDDGLDGAALDDVRVEHHAAGVVGA